MNHTRGSRTGSGARPGISTGDGRPPPERGVKFVRAALVTPGSARAASSTCVYRAASLAGSWARSGGGEIQKATSPWGSNPGFTARSCHRLLINSPAPTTRTTARAISLVTSPARRRCRPCPVPTPAVPSFSESVRSGRAARRAGKSPTATAVTTVRPSANASTQPSSCTVSSRGSTAGAARLSSATAPYAVSTPSAAPTDASTRLSVRSCRTTRPRRDRDIQLLAGPGWIGYVAGQDTDHAEHTRGERQGLPENVRVAAEAPLPLRVREDRHVGSRALFIGREQPSNQRALAEGREEAGGDGGHHEALDALGAGEPLAAAAHVSEPGECRALSPPIEEGWVRRRPECSLAALLGQHEQPILLGEGQRAKQHAVHHAEHGGVGADGECQGQDRRGREAGTLAEGPDRIPEVSEQSVHHSARRATVGSVATARRTGTTVAASDATVSPMAAPAYAAGSRGPTPNRNARTPRASNTAASAPHATPTMVTRTVSPNTRRDTSVAVAPTAIRIASSRPRCAMRYASTLYTPNSASVTAIAPKTVNRLAPRRQARSARSNREAAGRTRIEGASGKIS